MLALGPLSSGRLASPVSKLSGPGCCLAAEQARPTAGWTRAPLKRQGPHPDEIPRNSADRTGRRPASQ
jgi:hypothetical protein